MVAAGAFRPRDDAGGGGASASASASPPASPSASASASPFSALPAFCRVELALAPHPQSDVRVEVWLPASGWNGRFQGVGNRGWGGAINHAMLADALRAGFAAASTDTGHRGAGTSFAVGQPEKVVDAGHRAVHEMTVAAKHVIEAYYRRPAAQAYWNGCSLGGRQGLIEAQRYPDDYDGILVGDPVHELTSLYAARLALARIVHRSPGSYIPPEKYPAIHKAVVAACDGLDGMTDGVLEDPRLCRFDPGTLQCTAGDREDCLTAEQVETARAIYADVAHPRTGARLSAALTPGAELRWGAIAGASPERNALGLFRDVVLADAKWDWKSPTSLRS
jgi:feruloyl esterase